jgi:hypothetical protein
VVEKLPSSRGARSGGLPSRGAHPRLGTRVGVLFDERKVYNGLVEKYDPHRGFLVNFDDGETHWAQEDELKLPVAN